MTEGLPSIYESDRSGSSQAKSGNRLPPWNLSLDSLILPLRAAPLALRQWIRLANRWPRKLFIFFNRQAQNGRHSPKQSAITVCSDKISPIYSLCFMHCSPCSYWWSDAKQSAPLMSVRLLMLLLMLMFLLLMSKAWGICWCCYKILMEDCTGCCGYNLWRLCWHETKVIS